MKLLKTDLIINGADIDVVAYAHEQNSGNILKIFFCQRIL